MTGRDRGQSEVLDEILLVGLVVIAATTAGAAVVFGVVDVEERTLADLDATAVEGESRVVLVHQGGRAVAETDLGVRVTVDGTDRTATLNATASRGDGDGTFEAGDRWVFDLSGSPLADAPVDVRVTDRSTGTLLVDERLEPE